MPCTVEILRENIGAVPVKTTIGPISVKAAEAIAMNSANAQGVISVKIKKTR